MTTKLYTFLCADSGKSFGYRKISYMLSEELNKKYPAPRPPVLDVDIAGVKVREENKADPDYLAAAAAHSKEQEQRLQRLIIKRGVVIELSDTDKAEVAELRADMAELGVTLSNNDKEVWLWNIALATPEDYKDLITAIARRSGPTQEAMADARARFRADSDAPGGDGSNV